MRSSRRLLPLPFAARRIARISVSTAASSPPARRLDADCSGWSIFSAAMSRVTPTAGPAMTPL